MKVDGPLKYNFLEQVSSLLQFKILGLGFAFYSFSTRTCCIARHDKVGKLPGAHCSSLYHCFSTVRFLKSVQTVSAPREHGQLFPGTQILISCRRFFDKCDFTTSPQSNIH